MAIAAIILSGGRSRRFGGVHKPGVRLGSQTVISRILGTIRALDEDAEVWVAGMTAGLSEDEIRTVRSVREEPEFAGPLAGIDAACRAIANEAVDTVGGDASTPDVTLVLAGDMPMVGPRHLNALVRACRSSDLPATSIDDRGKLQFLCAAWPSSLLRSRLSEIGDTENAPVKLLFAGVEPVLVEADPAQLVDFDTPEEFARIDPDVQPGNSSEE